MKCPTEIAISDRREAELSKNGFLSMIHRKNSDFAAFIGGAVAAEAGRSTTTPTRPPTRPSRRACPTCSHCNRFAHYLKCIVRDKVGSFRSRESMQNWLQRVDPATTSTAIRRNSSEETKAQRPLAAAQVEVEEVEGNPGYYQSKFFLKPHYQLEGLTVSLRLVSKLPSEKSRLKRRLSVSTTGESIMAVNAFVSFFDKADGESIQKGKEKWIEIQGWDWEVEAESSWTKGGGASVGKPNPGKLNFEHYFDTVVDRDPGLHLHRQGVPEGASCEMMKTTGKGSPETYFTMTMEGAFITKVSNSGTEEGNVVAEGRDRLQDRQDRIQAAGQQDRHAARDQDLQLGHPGRHGVAVGLIRRRGESRPARYASAGERAASAARRRSPARTLLLFVLTRRVRTHG